jgi:hypothetical protein
MGSVVEGIPSYRLFTSGRGRGAGGIREGLTRTGKGEAHLRFALTTIGSARDEASGNFPNAMADEKKTTAPADATIDIHRLAELEYWARRFGISKQALISAIGEVGPAVADVRRHVSR